MEVVMNKITCICLGVKDMERSIKFYRDGLGYKTDCKENNPPVCFFDTSGTKFELFPLEQLAKDIDENNPPTGNGFAGITLAYNVEHKEDVDNIIELVRNAGGKIVKEPQDVFGVDIMPIFLIRMDITGKLHGGQNLSLMKMDY